MRAYQQRPQYPSLEQAGRLAEPAERLRVLCAASDKAGVFAWKHLSAVLSYAANRLPEIAASTLVLHGGANTVIDVRNAELLANRISGS